MHQELRSKLDRIIQNIWSGGGSEPTEYIEQVSYLIYLKLLDEQEDDRQLKNRLLGDLGEGDAGQSRSLFPKQAERYRWSKWRFQSGPELLNFVRDDVFPYLATLVKEAPKVAQFFQDARLTIDDPTILKTAVDELDQIKFSELGPDIKGDIFEYLIQYMATTEAANFGQFRTPRQIRNFMVRMIDPDFGDSIYDPACGTAGFLIDSVEYVLAKYSSEPAEYPIYGESWLASNGYEDLAAARKAVPKLQTYRKGNGDLLPDWKILEKSIYGHDVSRRLVRISMMNLVLHELQLASIKKGNSLSDTGGLSDDDKSRRYKVILSNPPFSGQLPSDSIRADLPTNSKKSELLFLSLMMQSLAPGGRCAVVLPEGVLFGSTSAHKDLRRKLLDEFEVLGVISLNSGVFKPYAGVKTSVLIFRRPIEGKKPSLEKVWFYDIRNDGYDPDKVSGGGRVETAAENDISDLMEEWEVYRKSGFSEVLGVEANSILPPESAEPVSWWADLDKIQENDCNLSASRYKPQIQEAISQESPEDLIEELIQAEDDIKCVLEGLLGELKK